MSTLLTQAAMVDNLAEKVNECPLNRGHEVLFAYNWNCENCRLYGVVGCPLFRGCVTIEVNGRTVGKFGISWVSAVEGCLLSGVPLYLVCYSKSFPTVICTHIKPFEITKRQR